MQNKLNRRKSRAVAMELLYSGTVNVRSGEITEEFLDDFISMSETTDNLDRNYIRGILNIVEGKEEYLKGVIRPFLKDWDINRLSRVNLAILKIAAGELLFMDDIPERVSLNEAIELAKTYSDEESTSFINGVLDKILKAKNQGTIEDEPTEAKITPMDPDAEAETVSEAGIEPGTAQVVSTPETSESSSDSTSGFEFESLESEGISETEDTPEDTTEEITEDTTEEISEDTTEEITEVTTEDTTEDINEVEYENAYEDLYEHTDDETTGDISNSPDETIEGLIETEETSENEETTKVEETTKAEETTETEESNYNY